VAALRRDGSLSTPRQGAHHRLRRGFGPATPALLDFCGAPGGLSHCCDFNSLSVHQTNGAYQAIKPNSAFFALHEPLSEAAFFRSSDLVNSACKLVYLVI
jgi:hypothetical protein